MQFLRTSANRKILSFFTACLVLLGCLLSTTTAYAAWTYEGTWVQISPNRSVPASPGLGDTSTSLGDSNTSLGSSSITYTRPSNPDIPYVYDDGVSPRSTATPDGGTGSTSTPEKKPSTTIEPVDPPTTEKPKLPKTGGMPIELLGLGGLVLLGTGAYFRRKKRHGKESEPND